MSFPLVRVALAVVLVAAVAVAATAFTAGLTVESSAAGEFQTAIDAQSLAPPECSALPLTAVVTGTTGTAASELIVGTAGADTIDGGGGSDCIVSGGGDDTVDGRGASVCVGGPGTDAFTGCSASYQ
jgi:Ca2+-binding RTX toxin-like protein